jgi:hypothetical protein
MHKVLCVYNNARLRHVHLDINLMQLQLTIVEGIEFATSADALLALVDVVVIVALPALTDSPPAVTVSPLATVATPSPRTLNCSTVPDSKS